MSSLPNIFVTTLAQTLASGGAASEVYVSSITAPDGTVIATANFAEWGRGILTIDPESSSRAEFISFTAVDGAGIGFTGITRGLSFNSNTSVAANKKFHAVGATVLISFGTHNIQDIVDKMADVGSAETVSGLWTFTTSPVVPTPTTATQAAPKSYVDGVAIAGGANASSIVKGISELTVDPVVPTTPVAVGSNDPQFVQYFTDTGTADAYVITPSPAVAAYAAGQRYSFIATHTNTGASTLKVGALAVKAIKKLNGATALVAGDIVAGQMIKVEYDGTNFQMLSPSAVTGLATDLKSATTTVNISAATAPSINQVLTATSSTAATWQTPPTHFQGLHGSGASSRDLSTVSGVQNIAHGLGTTPAIFHVVGAFVLAGFAQSFNGINTSSSATSGPPSSNTNTFRMAADGSNYQEAVITVDATNIILTWTKTGTPTGTCNIIWEALA